MALYNRNSAKRRIFNGIPRQQEDVLESLGSLGNRPVSSKSEMEQEKRIRREIANSNERRRMQSINAGFQSLRALLPHREGEKLSKAAILQQTTEYIYQLEQEKARLLVQNCHLKQMLNSQINMDSDGSSSDSPLPKRKKTETESSDEGIGNMSPAKKLGDVTEKVKQELSDQRVQLDRKHQIQVLQENQARGTENRICTDQVQGVVQIHPPENTEAEHLPQLHQHSFLQNEKPPSNQTVVLPQNKSDPSEKVVSFLRSSKHCPDIPRKISGKAAAVITPHSGDVIATSSSQFYVQESSAASSKSLPPTATEGYGLPLRPTDTEGSINNTALFNLYQANSTSRQNLETIVEAIRHLEGDHMFQDDPEPLKQCEQERTISDGSASHELNSPYNLLCKTNKNSHLNYQVIQCLSGTQSRPGVIVTNHS
ncbi:transcription factor AP-4-like isoform X2 [Limulus polyphemus]|uniref:Transcription factor AP-4-like isoform X2 n=1 Tax=Limulus polyphemus TaxID=6850 RepID=A0ABM1B7N9_LIMPO|nr:transcription factor AP-4-like isoform X2 [Limulus polyphemus]